MGTPPRHIAHFVGRPGTAIEALSPDRLHRRYRFVAYRLECGLRHQAGITTDEATVAASLVTGT